MKRGKSRRLFKKKKSHSSQRLGCIIAVIVLIPICYGLYLYYQQYSVQHSSSQNQTETSVSRSGYDKGHMAPAADMKWSPEVMKESFYFSNMCPQHPQLNRRGWKNLEEKIRDWAIADSAIIIICGPIINQSSRTIGKNKVAVPERFFKVVLSPFVKPVRGIGFLFNNRQAVEPLSTYAVTIDSIEKLTNMDFFSPLPDEIENEVEANADYYQWPH